MNVLEWAKNLEVLEPARYSELKTYATAYRLATDEYKEEIKKIIKKNIPLDDEFYRMVDYLEWLEDEANQFYKDCCERGGGYFNVY